MSMYVSVVTSPATTTRPVVISVSHATRPVGSSLRTASSTASEIWSAILSGCPSVTDSELKRKSWTAMRGSVPHRAGHSGQLQQPREVCDIAVRLREGEEALEHAQVRGNGRRHRL